MIKDKPVTEKAPKISVIIPCYNQGHYLAETLHSLTECNPALFEVIIVNDGSTDTYTNAYLKTLQEQGYNVIFQDNKGLPVARNVGIMAAKGEYILPLDSDNKIRKEYLTVAISILDINPEIAVVYGNAAFFGEKEGVWKVGEYNLQKLMLDNYIDACAVIRKNVILEVGLYDDNGIGGWEDWDLWLRISFANYKFYYVDEVLFDYRILHSSMSKQLVGNFEKRNKYLKYINDKYPEKMGHFWVNNLFITRFKKSPLKFLIKLVIRTYFPRYYNRLLQKNKIITGL